MLSTKRYKVSLMARKRYATKEIFKLTGVKRTTLQHWIKTGKIRPPALEVVGGKAARLWTAAQVKQLRELKGTLKPGPKKKKRP